MRFGRRPSPWRRILGWTLGGLLALLVVAQAVPYGRAHTNPPVTKDAPWPDTVSREIAHRACYDCHSNETRYPWYSNVAPMSWLLQHDIDEARQVMNFSEWDRPHGVVLDAPGMVESRAMPPSQYLLIHTDARLSDQERTALIAGLVKLGEDGGAGGSGGSGGGGKK
jgi:hypothetical protein